MDPLVHLAIIWAAVFAAVVAAKKTRLTPVLYFLFIGCVLANTGGLPAESGLFIRSFADLGIIFIMFSLGFEESTDNFLASARRSWGIALFGALGPFVVAYLIAERIWHDSHVSLMVGLAMTATAVAFFLVVTVIGVWLFPNGPLEWLRNRPLLRSVRMRHYLTFDEGKYATLAILLAALAVGLLAHVFGFHEAVGAYMAGLIVREEHFLPEEPASYDDHALENEHIYAKTRHVVDDAAYCWWRSCHMRPQWSWVLR